MKKNEITNKFKEIIKLFLDEEAYEYIDEIMNEDILFGQGVGIDSLLQIQILLEIERVFDIVINDEDMVFIFTYTLGELADYIGEKISFSHV